MSWRREEIQIRNDGDHANIMTPFDADGDQTSSGLRWSQSLRQFEIFLVAMNISSTRQQLAVLLHFAGDRVQDKFPTLHDTGAEYDYNRAKECRTN